MVERVAVLLGDLRKRVVFLGGAATSLLLTDPGALPVRVTRNGMVDEIRASTQNLREFVADTLGSWLKDSNFLTSVQGNLPPDRASQARFPLLVERLRALSRAVR